MTELLPCPFCGREPEIIEHDTDNDGVWTKWEVRCCHCTSIDYFSPRRLTVYPEVMFAGDCLDDVIREWNKRAKLDVKKIDDDELLPCPFCGREPEVVQLDPDRNSKHLKWEIKCEHGILPRGGFSRIAGEDGHSWCSETSFCGEKLEDVESAWNTRDDHMCTITSSRYDDLSEEWEYELSCGDYYFGGSKPPYYCPECGAKVM